MGYTEVEGELAIQIYRQIYTDIYFFLNHSVGSFQRVGDFLPCILFDSLINIFAKILVVNTGTFLNSVH